MMDHSVIQLVIHVQPVSLFRWKQLKKSKLSIQHCFQYYYILPCKNTLYCGFNLQFLSSSSRYLLHNANSCSQMGIGILSNTHRLWCHAPYDLGLACRHCSVKRSSACICCCSSSSVL